MEERTENKLGGRLGRSGRQYKRDETISRQKEDVITSPEEAGKKRVKTR